jgi:hypothetical protein
MSRDLPESDWKAFRKLREVALARFCERVLGEIGSIASTGATSYHDRYLKIYRLIGNRDEELARAFNDPRRSRAIFQLAAIKSYGLLSEEELLSFTPETREAVALLSKPPKGARRPKRA